jgi:hypothetical protein
MTAAETLVCERLSAEAYCFRRGDAVVGTAVYGALGWRWKVLTIGERGSSRKAHPTLPELVRATIGDAGTAALAKVMQTDKACLSG